MLFMTTTSTTTPFVVIGLNAALQKRFILKDDTTLIPGTVHRADRVQTGIGGKGQDVACALSLLCDATTTNIRLAQFVGKGRDGDIILQILQDRFGIEEYHTVRTESPVRICTSIVSTDATTELVEPSGAVSGEEFAALLNGIKQQSQSQEDTYLCCMGSLPPGCPDDAYSQIYQTVSPFVCVIDSTTGLDSVLQVADPERTIVKVNVAELCRFLQIWNPNTATCEAQGHSIQVIAEALRLFRHKGYACAVALTDGPHGAYFCDHHNDTTFRKYGVPKLDRDLLFPIGAGDAVAAGLLYGMRYSQEDPFAFGLACGSASCLHEENSIFDVRMALELYQRRKPAEIISLESIPDT